MTVIHQLYIIPTPRYPLAWALQMAIGKVRERGRGRDRQTKIQTETDIHAETER